MSKTYNYDQVCDGYNKKSLLGNWYEERLVPTPRDIHKDLQEKIVRKVEPNFAFESGSNIHNLQRIARLKMQSNDVVTLNNKNIKYTTTSHDAQKPLHGDQRSIIKFSGQTSLGPTASPVLNYHNSAKVFNSSTIYDRLAKDPVTNTPRLNTQRNYGTTYQNSYNIQLNQNQQSTLVKTQAVAPAHDIKTSLPLGAGEWKLKPNVHEPGFYRHMTSQITNMKNKPMSNR